MKLYCIRHAATSANYSGQMVNGYESCDIADFNKPDDWEDKIGKYIPDEARKFIISSPVRRCLSTSKMLFDRYPDEISAELLEFDCSALGNRKFWEITKAEFDSLVFLPWTTMEKRAYNILNDMCNVIRFDSNAESAVVISHGMILRYLYHFINFNQDISAYDVINSVGFTFSNLDLMIIDTTLLTTEVYHYQQPLEHK